MKGTGLCLRRPNTVAPITAINGIPRATIGIRTQHLSHTKGVLYQMSYCGVYVPMCCAITPKGSSPVRTASGSGRLRSISVPWSKYRSSTRAQARPLSTQIPLFKGWLLLSQPCRLERGPDGIRTRDFLCDREMRTAYSSTGPFQSVVEGMVFLPGANRTHRRTHLFPN